MGYRPGMNPMGETSRIARELLADTPDRAAAPGQRDGRRLKRMAVIV